MRKINFLYGFLFLFPSLLLGQDPEFSQFFSNPIYLNPAYTGTSQFTRFALNYRNQWPQNGATYKTYSLSIDSYLKRMQSGIGFQVFHDNQFNSVINTSSSAIYSHAININKDLIINAALQAGLVFKQFNPENLVFPSMIDQVNGNVTGYLPANFSNESIWYPDFAVGFVGMHNYNGVKKKQWQPNNYIFGGFSIHHLSRPTETLFYAEESSKIPLKHCVQLGTRMYWLSGFPARLFSFSPNFSYLQQGSFKQLNLGFSMNLGNKKLSSYKKDIKMNILSNEETELTFGLWYRNNLSIRTDALIFLMGFAVEKFYIGYSFDYTISKLSNYSYGSHEISIIFLMGHENCSNLNKKTKQKDKIILPII